MCPLCGTLAWGNPDFNNKPRNQNIMTFKEYKDMIEDRNALEAADRAAFSRDQAVISGGGDPDMCITYVSPVGAAHLTRGKIKH
jgi:hypothetical protein